MERNQSMRITTRNFDFQANNDLGPKQRDLGEILIFSSKQTPEKEHLGFKHLTANAILFFKRRDQEAISAESEQNLRQERRMIRTDL